MFVGLLKKKSFWKHCNRMIDTKSVLKYFKACKCRHLQVLSKVSAQRVFAHTLSQIIFYSFSVNLLFLIIIQIHKMLIFFFFLKVQRQRAHFTSSINTCYLSRMWSDLVQSLQCSEFTARRFGYLANREAFHLQDILCIFFYYLIIPPPPNKRVKVISH